MPIFPDCIQRGVRSTQPTADDVTKGTLYWVTDEQVCERSNGVVWELYSAKAFGMDILSGTIAQQPTGLTPAQSGLLYMVTPYQHIVRWNGAAWEFAPGDCGNGFFVHRAIAPQESGWALCNGLATDYLKVGAATLTAQPFTLPDLFGTPAYLKGSTGYNGVINAALGANTNPAGSGITIGGQPLGFTEWQVGTSAPFNSGAAGSHSHGGGTGAAGAHGHAASADAQGAHGHTFAADTGTSGTGAVADAGGNFFANSNLHTHHVAGSTDVVGNHSHNISVAGAADHAHGIGADGNHTHVVQVPEHYHQLQYHDHALPNHSHYVPPGEPAYMAALVYFRR